MQAATFKCAAIKNETPVKLLSCQFGETFKTAYFARVPSGYEPSKRLLLDQHQITI